MADAEESSYVNFREMYLALDHLRREMADAVDRHSERVVDEIRHLVDDKQEQHERLEARIEAERIAREKDTQQERDARQQLQLKVVTFIAIATGVITTVMFLLNLFGPLIRDSLRIPT